jgi:outer membrane protein assembly factor BamB
MNISNKFWLLFLLMLVGMLSCATDSGSIETVSTGEVNSGWKMPFDGSDSEPIIHNGIIYVGSFDGSVYAIDPKNGKQI